MNNLWIPLSILAFLLGVAAIALMNSYDDVAAAKAGLEQVVEIHDGHAYTLWKKTDCDHK